MDTVESNRQKETRSEVDTIGNDDDETCCVDSPQGELAALQNTPNVLSLAGVDTRTLRTANVMSKKTWSGVDTECLQE